MEIRQWKNELNLEVSRTAWLNKIHIKSYIKILTEIRIEKKIWNRNFRDVAPKLGSESGQSIILSLKIAFLGFLRSVPGQKNWSFPQNKIYFDLKMICWMSPKKEKFLFRSGTIFWHFFVTFYVTKGTSKSFKFEMSSWK